MSSPTMQEAKRKIVEHLRHAKQGVTRDIARATGIDKHLVDKAVGELVGEEELVYVSYGGVTYVALASQFHECRERTTEKP